ncbi:MAG: DUF1595 domain-containing protein, partial [Myxococcales bacterium]|nr:DUF1595 domain-containing protein [Myxococcales bacterium]
MAPPPRFRSPGTLTSLALAALAMACTGGIEGPATGAGDSAGAAMPPSGRGRVRSCDETQINLTPVRLLTRDEYNHTVRDLLGDETNPLIDSPSTETATFDKDAQSLTISSPMARHYLEVGEGIATRAMQKAADILPCTPAGDGRACAEEFIRDFGTRAFRRPIPEADVTALLGLFDTVRPTGTFNESIGLIIEAVLNSPRFLYHIEVGAPVDGEMAALDDYEIASKLSYFLWNTMPDEELFEAAAKGELHTEEQIRTQATRM